MADDTQDILILSVTKVTVYSANHIPATHAYLTITSLALFLVTGVYLCHARVHLYG